MAAFMADWWEQHRNFLLADPVIALQQAKIDGLEYTI